MEWELGYHRHKLHLILNVDWSVIIFSKYTIEHPYPLSRQGITILVSAKQNIIKIGTLKMIIIIVLKIKRFGFMMQ